MSTGREILVAAIFVIALRLVSWFALVFLLWLVGKAFFAMEVWP